jgi:hypothetical protein
MNGNVITVKQNKGSGSLKLNNSHGFYLHVEWVRAVSDTVIGKRK